LKLIKEFVENVEYLTEESGGTKSLFIQGPFLVAEKQNKNGRLYKEQTMSREVARYLEEYVDDKRAYGELGHPDTPNINPDRISHLIVNLKQEGTNWIGKAKILETPMGNIARKIMEGGGKLGVSSRGMGTLKNVNGVNIVQDDFRLATAADIVVDPSAPGAFVQGIMENKEWMLVDGVWSEQDQEISKKSIRTATVKEIEAISLKIWESFVRKL
jgi:Prohead core protein serine protease